MDPAAVFPSVSGGLLFGTLETLTLGNPAPGTDFDLLLHDGYWHRILTGHYTYTTSVAVANRTLGLQLNTGTNVVYISRPSTPITASLTVEVGFYRLGQISMSTAALCGNTPLPDCWLPPGSHLKSTTTGADGADQISNIAVYCERVSVKNLEDMYAMMGEDMHANLAPGKLSQR